MKNKIKVFVLSLLAINLGICMFPLVVSASQTQCSAGITFDINPKQITDTQSATISGSTILYTPGGITCGVAGSGADMQNFIVSIYDQTSSKELFYLSGFNITGVAASEHKWDLNPKQIGATELKNLGLSSATSLSVVAIPKVSDANGNWYQLSKSAPVSVSVSITAAATTGTTTNSGTTGTVSTSSSTTSGMSNNSATTFYNPISGVDNLTDLLLRIMQGFLAIIGAWSVAFIIVGGFQMVISQGNEEAVLKAKKTILWAVGGLIIAILAFSIIAIVQNLIGINIQNVSTFIYTISKIS